MMPDPLALVAVTALHVLAAAGAIYLSRPSHAPYFRPVAWLFGGSLVTELVRWANRELLLKGLPRPLTGWHRVPGHLEQALALAWPAAVVTLVWWAFRPREAPRWRLAWPACIAGAAWLYLVTHYPEIRAARLDDFYYRVGVVECVTVLVLAVQAWKRAPTWPLVTDRVALLLTAAELARFGGALAWGHSPMKDADLDTLVYGGLYLLIILVQGAEAWRR